MIESFTSDIFQISENDVLTTELEKEVKEAIFQMEHNKAPGPDGYLAEFFQVFSGINKRWPHASVFRISKR